MENAAQVVALEYLAAAQGLEFLEPLQAGAGPRAARAFLRRAIPPLGEDRPQGEEVRQILAWMRSGKLVAAAEGAAGILV